MSGQILDSIKLNGEITLSIVLSASRKASVGWGKWGNPARMRLVEVDGAWRNVRAGNVKRVIADRLVDNRYTGKNSEWGKTLAMLRKRMAVEAAKATRH